ncbi:hypothetical protein [Levilactobacillus bambusae]|uniref:Uncharacterized protein n=1 Tax=Levilactobacillus bambusae TaxID=2024736 RepID=A0A2V1MYC0_9LACO|nr:hypothetical protein [Levilactobacillus bambusae]PWG00014.1 hypothetical protein DCM90_03490 [Levilactobacillus bambusae]
MPIITNLYSTDPDTKELELVASETNDQFANHFAQLLNLVPIPMNKEIRPNYNEFAPNALQYVIGALKTVKTTGLRRFTLTTFQIKQLIKQYDHQRDISLADLEEILNDVSLEFDWYTLTYGDPEMATMIHYIHLLASESSEPDYPYVIKFSR